MSPIVKPIDRRYFEEGKAVPLASLPAGAKYMHSPDDDVVYRIHTILPAHHKFKKTMVYRVAQPDTETGVWVEQDSI